MSLDGDLYGEIERLNERKYDLSGENDVYRGDGLSGETDVLIGREYRGWYDPSRMVLFVWSLFACVRYGDGRSGEERSRGTTVVVVLYVGVGGIFVEGVLANNCDRLREDRPLACLVPPVALVGVWSAV